MVTENATERHTTANEEEVVVAMDRQPGDSDTMDPIIAYPMRAPRMNSVTYYIRGGLKKVQMKETPIIFLWKRYDSVVVRIQS
jgi:hypothetical protein